MAAIRVRVGASIDASLAQVFRRVNDSSRDAQRLMLQQSKSTNSAQLALLKNKAAAEKAGPNGVAASPQSVADTAALEAILNSSNASAAAG